jgi:probable HAF family extracellular repeat protein
MHDLGALGGDWSRADAVNNRGQVVGQAQTDTGEIHPFLWRKGHMTDLAERGLGGDYVTVTDINDRGEIVGRRPVEMGVWHAFRWSDGRVIDLGPADSWDSGAEAISNRGTVAGYSVPAGSTNPISHPTLWRGGTALDIGTAGGLLGEAYGVNDRGQVVGSVSGGPFVWQRGTFTILPVLSSTPTLAPRATDVNEAGVVVGYSDDSDAPGGPISVVWLPVRHGS